MSTRGGRTTEGGRARTGGTAATTAAKAAKPPSHAARQKAALDRAATALGPNANEPQRLRTALMEAAVERLATDAAFAARVRERYAASGQTARRSTSTRTPEAAPRPLGVLALGEYNALGKFDPYLLSRNYTPGDFPKVLQSATVSTLREGVDAVQARNPGTKPASRTRKADLIDYIVSHMPQE